MSTIEISKSGAPAGSDISFLGYSVQPFQLALELSQRLSRETARIDSALMVAMQESLTQALRQPFGGIPPQVDPSIMKKLSNSLLSAGSSGIERTNKSLFELHLANRLNAPELDISELTQSLRSEVNEFRKASAYIDNQAKCIKAFLNSFQENFEALEKKKSAATNSVRTRKDLVSWSERLVELWLSETRVDPKNHPMYLNAWSIYIETLTSESGDSYADALLKNVRSYLPKSDYENFERAYVRLQDKVPTAAPLQSAPKSTLKLEGGVTSLSTTFKLQAAQVAQIKDDLFFMIANDALLKTHEIEISIPEDEPDTVVIKFTPPSEMIAYRRMIEALNKNVQEAYSHIG